MKNASTLTDENTQTLEQLVDMVQQNMAAENYKFTQNQIQAQANHFSKYLKQYDKTLRDLFVAIGYPITGDDLLSPQLVYNILTDMAKKGELPQVIPLRQFEATQVMDQSTQYDMPAQAPPPGRQVSNFNPPLGYSPLYPKLATSSSSSSTDEDAPPLDWLGMPRMQQPREPQKMVSQPDIPEEPKLKKLPKAKTTAEMLKYFREEEKKKKKFRFPKEQDKPRNLDTF